MPQTLASTDSPINYWISKTSVWPQLAKMALDIYATPAMSDEPERVFSMAGNVLTPRRRCLTDHAVEQILCLRSWQKSGIITLNHTLFEEAVTAVEHASVHDNINATTYADSDDQEEDEDSPVEIE